MKICEIKNSSKSVLQIFLKFYSKRYSPLKINCENFKIVCTVGLKQSSTKVLTRIELRVPFIHARAHLTSCIACQKARVKALLPVVYGPFLSFIIGPKLKHMFESSFKLLLRILK